MSYHKGGDGQPRGFGFSGFAVSQAQAQAQAQSHAPRRTGPDSQMAQLGYVMWYI